MPSQLTGKTMDNNTTIKGNNNGAVYMFLITLGLSRSRSTLQCIALNYNALRRLLITEMYTCLLLIMVEYNKHQSNTEKHRKMYSRTSYLNYYPGCNEIFMLTDVGNVISDVLAPSSVKGNRPQ